MLNFALFAAIIGCSDSEEKIDDSQDTGNYMPYCSDVETPLALDEVSQLGISGEDFMNNLATNYTTTVRFSDDTETCLSGSVSPDTATFRFVESTAVYPEAPPGTAVPAIAVECSNYIAVDGYYSLLSEDGVLDEEVWVTFTISEESLLDSTESINAEFTVEVETFSGSIEVTSEEEISSLNIQGKVGSDFSGSVTMLTTGGDGDIAWASIETLAEWTGEMAPDCDGFE